MTASNNVVLMQEIRSRLPMSQGAVARGITPPQWRVLVETTFPSAKSVEAIEMAFDYCTARDLDIFKKPVHIVPMWSSEKRAYVETIWPGINEIQITAARTGAWAGMESPKWGQMVTRTFSGHKKSDGKWGDVSVEVTYPEWCEVTVYRIVGGQRCPFCEPVYWEEAYSTSGGKNSEIPTDMWIKRPRGQLHKVAKAASLRAAFPEEGEYTAEEMEGKVIESGGVVIDQQHSPLIPQKDNAEENVKFEEKIIALVNAAMDLNELDNLWRDNLDHIKKVRAENANAGKRIIAKFSEKKQEIVNATTHSEQAEEVSEDKINDDASQAAE